MRDELAERLLATVMDGDAEWVQENVPRLQRLARLKYDEYGGYAPGEKFIESLASWLRQFSMEDRRVALRFVFDQLVFVSRAELDHLISLSYARIIGPMVLRVASKRTGVEFHRVAHLSTSDEFRGFQRRILILGLSDGARLDRLRRSSPLSHEQFFPAQLDPAARKSAKDALAKALKSMGLGGDPQFEHVLLVDDFYGTGRTLVRDERDGSRAGRLLKIRAHLRQLEEEGLISNNATVSVLVYVASANAAEYVRDQLAREGLAWSFDVLQLLPPESVVVAPEVRELCSKFYDPVLTDEHKGEASMGYFGAALPIVMEHNAPNDSISPLWADTRDRPDSQLRRALFPRYERHHADRP